MQVLSTRRRCLLRILWKFISLTAVSTLEHFAARVEGSECTLSVARPMQWVRCEARPGLVREIIVWYLNQSPTCESRPDTGCHYPPAHTNYTLYTTHHILQHKLETRCYIVCQHRPQSSSLLIMQSNFESLYSFFYLKYFLLVRYPQYCAQCWPLRVQMLILRPLLVSSSRNLPGAVS